MKCGCFSETTTKKTLLMSVAKSFPEARKGWGWGKITAREMGTGSNVDKPGRGETSCTVA